MRLRIELHHTAQRGGRGGLDAALHRWRRAACAPRLVGGHARRRRSSFSAASNLPCAASTPPSPTSAGTCRAGAVTRRTPRRRPRGRRPASASARSTAAAARRAAAAAAGGARPRPGPRRRRRRVGRRLGEGAASSASFGVLLFGHAGLTSRFRGAGLRGPAHRSIVPRLPAGVIPRSRPSPTGSRRGAPPPPAGHHLGNIVGCSAGDPPASAEPAPARLHHQQASPSSRTTPSQRYSEVTPGHQVGAGDQPLLQQGPRQPRPTPSWGRSRRTTTHRLRPPRSYRSAAVRRGRRSPPSPRVEPRRRR